MFFNQRLGYKSLLKKYSFKKILKMYMQGEIKLNKKEWKDLHKRFERKRLFKEKTNIINFAICFLIIVIFSYNHSFKDFNEIERCSKVYEHFCNKYELEEFKNNN